MTPRILLFSRLLLVAAQGNVDLDPATGKPVHCDAWAAAGECTRNQKYMMTQCADSCKKIAKDCSSHDLHIEHLKNDLHTHKAGLEEERAKHEEAVQKHEEKTREAEEAVKKHEEVSKSHEEVSARVTEAEGRSVAAEGVRKELEERIQKLETDLVEEKEARARAEAAVVEWRAKAEVGGAVESGDAGAEVARLRADNAKLKTEADNYLVEVENLTKKLALEAGGRVDEYKREAFITINELNMRIAELEASQRQAVERAGELERKLSSGGVAMPTAAPVEAAGPPPTPGAPPAPPVPGAPASEEVTAELDALKKELESTKETLKTAQASLAACPPGVSVEEVERLQKAEAEFSQTRNDLENTKKELDSCEGQKTTMGEDLTTANEVARKAEEEQKLHKTQAESLQKDLDAKQTELDTKQTELDTKQTELEAKQVELVAAQAAGSSSDAEKQKKTEDLAALEQQKQDLQAEVRRVKEEVGRVKEELSNAASKCEEEVSAVKDRQDAVAQQRIDDNAALSTQLQKTAEELSAAQADLNFCKAEEERRKQQDSNNPCAHLEKEIQEMTATKNLWTDANRNLTNNLNECRSVLEVKAAADRNQTAEVGECLVDLRTAREGQGKLEATLIGAEEAKTKYQADLNECAAIRERLENELSIAKQELSQPPPACNCDDQVNLAVAEQQKLQAGLIDESELTPSMCGSKFRLWGTTTFALVAFTKVASSALDLFLTFDQGSEHGLFVPLYERIWRSVGETKTASKLSRWSANWNEAVLSPLLSRLPANIQQPPTTFLDRMYFFALIGIMAPSAVFAAIGMSLYCSTVCCCLHCCGRCSVRRGRASVGGPVQGDGQGGKGAGKGAAQRVVKAAAKAHSFENEVLQF